MQQITINTVQGIGDIFWVYQKLAPHANELHIRPCVTSLDDKRAKIQARALVFTRSLPKVKTAELKLVPAAYYDNLATTRYDLKDLLQRAEAGNTAEFDYACNRPLEEGIRLEAIDGDLAIERTVPLTVEPCNLPFPAKSYIVAYVSGDTVRTAKLGVAWQLTRWTKFIDTVRATRGKDTAVVVIGAHFDKVAMLHIANSLRRVKRRVAMLEEYPLSKLYHILQNASLFVGYQSGLNVLADNFDVPQIMIYYPKLAAMLRAWPKQQNLDNGTHVAALFTDKDADIIRRIPGA